MPKRNLIWIAVMAVLVVGMIKIPDIIARRDALYNKYSTLLTARIEILKRYVEDVDEEELVQGAVGGMLDALDPYCEYYTPEELEQFKKHTDGEFIGIGVEVVRTLTGDIRIVSPIEGSPAFLAGLRPNDLITAIDGQRTADLNSLTEAVKLMTGDPNSSVKLEIYRPSEDEILDKTIVRRRITVPSVRGWARAGTEWDYLIDEENRIGYIRILNFESHTAEQFEAVLDGLYTRGKLRGLIIDVRDNPGGLLDVVVEISNLFVTDGVIVSTRGRRTPERRYVAQSDKIYPRIPTVILVNRGSASASEILGGAMRDLGVATLIGETTYGKGSVQELITLENGKGAVKLTTAYYYLPNGERIHGTGVTPSEVVELNDEQKQAIRDAQRAVYEKIYLPEETGEGDASTKPARVEILIDPQLERALEVIRGRLATLPAG